MSKINALIKQDSRTPFHHLRTQGKDKMAVYESGSQASPDTESASTLTLGLLASRKLQEINFCCSYATEWYIR